MIFEIDFNHPNTKDAYKILEKLGCSIDRHPEYSRYIKEINSLEEMKQFQEDVWKVTANISYSFVLDFGDCPTIYLDDKV